MLLVQRTHLLTIDCCIQKVLLPLSRLYVVGIIAMMVMVLVSTARRHRSEKIPVAVGKQGGGGCSNPKRSRPNRAEHNLQ